MIVLCDTASQEIIGLAKTFSSFDALKTAVSEHCEEEGTTWKFLYPWNGRLRPVAFICGCEVSRPEVKEEFRRVEQKNTSGKANCRAEGTTSSVNMQVCEDNAAAAASATQGSCSGEVEFSSSAPEQRGESSSAPTEGLPSKAGVGTATLPEHEVKPSNRARAVLGERYLEYELKVRKRECCSFFVVSIGALHLHQMR